MGLLFKRRHFPSPLPQSSIRFSSLARCGFSPSRALPPFLERGFGHGNGGAGGGEGERVVAERPPGRAGAPGPAEGRRGGADGAVGGADRGPLGEDRVPRREAGGRAQEIQVRVPDSRRVAGAGEYRLSCVPLFFSVFASSSLFSWCFLLLILMIIFVPS